MKPRIQALCLTLLGTVLVLKGLFMVIGGAQLAWLGGSWFFALAGLGLLASGTLIALRRPMGVGCYLVVLIGTLVWSLGDSGTDFWPLFSRLGLMGALTVAVLLSVPVLIQGDGNCRRRLSSAAKGLAALTAALLAGVLYVALQPQPIQTALAAHVPTPGGSVGGHAGGNWLHYGRTPSGTRHAPLDQISPENVSSLEVAWTYQTGEIPEGRETHVVTPLHVDGVLYGCTQSSRVFALDADTGREIWRFDPKASRNFLPRCRGLGYFAEPAESERSAGVCARRIISTTVDARLVALDASTGQPCPDFGEGGEVSLRLGMGEIKPGFYFPTAAPTVARDRIIVGGLVRDNQEVGEPSGVVRAFDVHSGELVWAWDAGNPAITKLPPEGETYTRGTPNVWSTPAFDEALGLVYLPTGNATPDFWGGHRTEADDRYSSSVVALDIETGRERWRFQTVHHDLWDYDVSAQPALYDVSDGRGGTIPALIQTTKRGQIFMLDRRNGHPIAEVQERPVPQGGVADEHTSPTQPYSVGMPALGTEPLNEQRMWGLSLLDQLACRIAFREARYEGEFTPPTEQWTIQYPGWMGGTTWGSVTIAENLGYMVLNDTRLAVMNRLVRREAFDAQAAAGGGGAPQRGTPWGVQQKQFLSPLGIPCQEPPYGTLSAIDLSTRQLVWSQPLGTVEDTGPLGIPTGMPIPIGMPTRGGPLSTASGLVFIAGTQDRYLRALDTLTGHELWREELPVGAEATPMSFVSPASGRQFILISAGGNSASPTKGDHIVAFALPPSTDAGLH